MEFFENVRNRLVAVYDFLVSLLGGTKGIIQTAIVGGLTVLLLLSLILAIVNPSGRRKKRLDKEKKLNDRIRTVQEEIKNIEAETEKIESSLSFAENDSEKRKNELIEQEKRFSETDRMIDESRRTRLSELEQERREIEEVSAKRQRGLFRSKAADAEKAYKLGQIEKEKEEIYADSDKRNAEKNRRAEILAENIAEINKELDKTKLSFGNKLSEYEIRLKLLRDELEELEAEKLAETKKKSKRQLAKEKRERKEEEAKSAEIKALDELSQAKTDYENAVSDRIKAEKDKELAVENVKNEEKEKKNLAKQKDAMTVQSATTTDLVPDETDDEDEEEEGASDETDDEETTYGEDNAQTDEPSDFFNAGTEDAEQLLFGDEVVITDVSASLEYDEEEEEPEETAIPEEQTVMNFDEYEKAENRLLYAAPVVEKMAIPAAEEPKTTVKQRRIRPNYIQIKEQSFSEEAISSDDKKEEKEKTEEEKPLKSENAEKKKTVKQNHLYDGIPATPVHKKSKFQKPVTKLIAKETAESAPKAVAEKAETDKKEKPAKWKISENGGLFKATLYSSDGVKLVSTEEYSALGGLKNAVASINNNLAENKAEVVESDGKFYIRILSAAGKNLLAEENYQSKYRCEKAIYNSKINAANAIFEQ